MQICIFAREINNEKYSFLFYNMQVAKNIIQYDGLL